VKEYFRRSNSIALAIFNHSAQRPASRLRLHAHYRKAEKRQENRTFHA
jgi:ribosomal protein L31E